MEDVLLDWISFTCFLLAICISIIIDYAWKHGRDYKIIGNRGYRLNFIQKFFDGLVLFLKA